MSVARAVGRNTAFNLVARTATMAAWFLATPALLTSLGAERFGFWSILLAVGGVLATADLGFGVAVSRFSAEHVGQGRIAAIPRLLWRAGGLQLAFSLVLAAAALLLREPILDLVRVGPSWRPEARAAFAITALGFTLGVPFNLLTAALQGLQRMDLHARVVVPGAVLLFAALLAAGRSATPLVAVTAVQVGVLVVLVLGNAWMTALALHGLKREAAPQPVAPVPEDGDGVHLGRLVRYSLWIQVNSLLAMTQQHMDKLLIAGLVALGPVAAYELGMRIASVAMLLPILLLGSLLPAIAGRQAAAPGARVALYERALEPYFALVAVLTAGVLSLAGPLLLAWLGRVRAEELFALRMLALAAGLSALTGVASTVVRAAGNPRMETVYAVSVVVLHLALSLLGRLWFGWQGVLYGLVAALLLASPIFIARVEGWLGLAPLAPTSRALTGPLAAGLVGAAAAWGALHLLPAAGATAGRGRGLLDLAVGGSAFVSAAVLVLWRLTPGTLQQLWSLPVRLRSSS